MKGRKPKPTMLKNLHGNSHKAKSTRNLHEPEIRAPLGNEPPEWMTPSQKAGWRYAMAHAPHGLLRALDLGTLAVWVVAEDLHRQATVAFEASSAKLIVRATGKDDNSKIVANPLLGIITKQALVMIKAASELGFTPASRSRIQVVENSADAPFATSLDAFLATHPDAPTSH